MLSNVESFGNSVMFLWCLKKSLQADNNKYVKIIPITVTLTQPTLLKTFS